MSLNQNKALAEPTLTDLLNLWMKQTMLNMNCIGIARISEFNSENRTVTAEMNYQKTSFSFDEVGNPIQNNINYPILLDCPIVVLGGGSSSIRFPISAGDNCIILFNDRDIDNWMSSPNGPAGPVASTRLHSFSDGIALVGFNFDGSAWDLTRASLQFGNTRVAVSEEKVLIENENTTLNTLLAQLIDDIKDLVTQVAAITVTGVTTGMGTSGPPSNVSAINAITTQLMNTADAIAGLLE